MPAVRHCSRVDTFEFKVQMEGNLGAQKSEKYFNLLTRYLSLKLGKSEFDKLCIHLIGRDNIHLHNELVKEIIENAAVCNSPPPKKVKHINPLTFKDTNVGLQSPRNGRNPDVCEGKFKGDKNRMVEVSYRRIPITAPFGVNIHSNETRKELFDDLGSGYGYYTEMCHYSGQLLSKTSLENQLKQKLKLDGLDISTDSVNILNSGLDSYLKRVIKPSLDLASSRSIHEHRKRFTASLLDFQMAVLTDPNMLGDNWSIQLEKILEAKV
ncbi:uncharacterized protein LOC143539714 [Bidens hawaiensis]|uniref:uncharacterized protein LOC143539714 n=1 Tax=Bidens hawaiensis TaxID=980011 RepID=UPI00404B3C8C